MLAALALPLVLALPAGAQEVGSSRVVPIQVTGDAAKRFSLVILSEGYTAADMPKFREHVDKHLNILWALEPFRSYRNYINVYAVEIVSGESGITCDPEVREIRNTPLRLHFGGGCDNPNARGITPQQQSDYEIARAYARTATPDYDQILVIANTDTYGGIGGSIATTSGGNALGPYITPHEIGHSLGRLQDEYTYSARGRAGAAYTGDEPNSIHHTILSEAEMRAQQKKWWRWLGEESESGGKIGLFEGGQSRTSGIWRPSKHSMMISLGYYFDQVSRERMAQRISGQVELIAASTPTDAPVPADDVIWIETPQPNFHELNIEWTVNGRRIESAANNHRLALAPLRLGPGDHRVEVKVVDPTDFVRDPIIRDTSFTATRTWTVRGTRAQAATLPGGALRFTNTTQTTRPVSGREVVYAFPSDRDARIAWRLNGTLVPDADNRSTFNLAKKNLPPGTHRLSATVSDPNDSERASQTIEWVVDNTGPTVRYELSPPVATRTSADGVPHVFMRDQFTMKLEPADDQPGHVVAEFRVNGDGWHHYYGWPDAPPGTPFLFTPRGTTIKELVYGSLSSEGLSPQPWEERRPGWGTHRIEYRARDAAGNIGEAREFRVTIAPTPQCTSTLTGNVAGPVNVRTGVTCLDGATVQGAVTVSPGAALVALRSRIAGPLTATNAEVIELVGTAVNGDVRIEGATGRMTIFDSTCGGANRACSVR